MVQISDNIFRYSDGLCILFFAKSKRDKASIVGFGAMLLAYAGSVFLMWN